MRFLLAFVLLAAAAFASGCGGSSAASGGDPPPAASATVDIKSFKYAPVTITVKKGGRVRWTNSDTAAHTATADERSFDTQTIDKGAARTVTFTTPGTVAYHCDFHPFMKATVVVK
jgi:plastocyanin